MLVCFSFIISLRNCLIHENGSLKKKKGRKEKGKKEKKNGDQEEEEEEEEEKKKQKKNILKKRKKGENRGALLDHMLHVIVFITFVISTYLHVVKEIIIRCENE